MIYVPEQFNIENNYFSYNDNIITVYSNCQNNECTCIDIYTTLDYRTSENYLCNMNNVHLLNEQITNDFSYRIDYYKILIIFAIFTVVIILIPFRMIMKFFKITI